MADDAEAEKARAEAEARREKILQKSRDRMKVVSGLQAEADAENDETKTSSAARMQAMRRRRFKKSAKQKDEKSEETEAPKEEEATEEKAKEETSKEAEIKEEATPARTSDSVKSETVSKSEAAEAASTEATPVEHDEKEESGESKKKYKGIVKIRREKMLAKKKEEQVKQEEEAKTASTSEAAIARRSKKLKSPMLPIIMYIFTVVLLFLAGLDVGLQHVDDKIVVHTELAPHSFRLSKLNPWGSKSSETVKNLESDTESYSRELGGGQDEFDTTFGPDDPEYTPNIDPLFRVDLDAHTRGPGFFMQLARGAVKIHRFFLFILWETPMQMFALPMQFFQHPPVMCLVAIAIRQIVAKILLGAKLPDIAGEDVRDKKGEVSDVLDMARNFVSNTMSTMFPTAVILYEGFKHLRADMYIVLCGVFVGLAYSSQMAKMIPAGEDAGGYDDMPPEPDTPAGGLSDEL